MNYETILLGKSNGVATITLNRPDKLNALNHQMSLDLLDVVREVDSDPEVRVVVLTGSGRAFCAGADMQEFLEATQDRGSWLNDFNPAPSHFQNLPFSLHDLSKPTIAALNGPAVGVGLSFSVACDIRIASEKAKLGAIFTQVGLVPEYGTAYTLPRLLGVAKACELVFTSKIVSAEEARAIGLVNQVVPADQLEAVTMEMASRIASLPPRAIQMAKRLLYHGLDNDLNTMVHFATVALDWTMRTEDHAEAVRAFIEKRTPRFQGK